jgi:hypothetical protein
VPGGFNTRASGFLGCGSRNFSKLEFLEKFRFWAHFRRFEENFKAPETGLSTPIFFAGK